MSECPDCLCPVATDEDLKCCPEELVADCCERCRTLCWRNFHHDGCQNEKAAVFKHREHKCICMARMAGECCCGAWDEPLLSKRGMSDAELLAMLEANVKAQAEDLERWKQVAETLRKERDATNAALDELMVKVSVGSFVGPSVALVDLMQTRYARERDQWKANHDQRKAERDESRVLVEQLRVDAVRYRRLRVLGCAPAETKHLETATVLRFQNLDDFTDDDIAAHPSRGEAE